jgi:putative endonuclease
VKKVSRSKNKLGANAAANGVAGFDLAPCDVDSGEVSAPHDAKVVSTASEDKCWFVYMVETEKGKLYTGISTDVERRFSEHLSTHLGNSTLGAKYFRSDKPLRVAYCEKAANRSSATKREREIKKMNASGKKRLLLAD